MLVEESNAAVNVQLINHENTVEFTDKEKAICFLNYLEWLLPYHCENKDVLTKKIDSLKERKFYIHLDMFHFDKGIGYATRIDLSLTTCLKRGYSCISQKHFKQPFFQEADRNLATYSQEALSRVKLLIHAYLP